MAKYYELKVFSRVRWRLRKKKEKTRRVEKEGREEEKRDT